MAPKVVDVDPDNTDSECEEKPSDPQLSSAVTLNEQNRPQSWKHLFNTLKLIL